MRPLAREAAAVAWRAAALAVLVLAALDAAHRGLPLSGTVAVCALSVLALRALPRRTGAAAADPAARTAPAPRTVDTGAARLEGSLVSPEHFDRVLRPRLAVLATDRLRRRHAVDPDSDPARAAALLGAAAVLLHPTRGLPDRAAVSALLDRIEDL